MFRQWFIYMVQKLLTVLPLMLDFKTMLCFVSNEDWAQHAAMVQTWNDSPDETHLSKVFVQVVAIFIQRNWQRRKGQFLTNIKNGVVSSIIVGVYRRRYTYKRITSKKSLTKMTNKYEYYYKH